MRHSAGKLEAAATPSMTGANLHRVSCQYRERVWWSSDHLLRWKVGTAGWSKTRDHHGSAVLQWDAACWDPWWWWDQEIWFKTSHKGSALAINSINYECLSHEYKKIKMLTSNILWSFNVSIDYNFLYGNIYRQHYFYYLFCSVKCPRKTDPPNDHIVAMLSFRDWRASLNYTDPLSWHSGMLGEDLLQIL